MTAHNFCYWLQGFFELNGATRTAVPAGSIALTIEQSRMIQAHLALVFKHEIDPAMGGSETQAQLNAIHGSEAHPTVHNPFPAPGPNAKPFDPQTTLARC